MTGRQSRKDESPAETIAGAGQHLRAARESQGLDISQIAAQLHLSVDMIEAVEEDDHEHLPGPVFVRGYLRNYARILGLNVDSIIAAYEATEPKDVSSRPLKKTPRIRTEVGSSHLIIRLITWLIVIGLIVLLVLWWRGELEWAKTAEFGIPSTPEATPRDFGESLTETQSGREAARSSLESEGSPLSALPPSPPLEEEQPVTADSTPETDTEFVRAEPGETEAAESTEESPLESRAGMEDGGSFVAEATQAVTESESNEQAPDMPAPANTFAPEEPVATTAVSVPPTSTSKVVLRFSGPCWVNIRDASRTFRLVGQMRAGDSRTLEGTPPYSVVIGDKHMVTITVDGETFDISRHGKGKVARFELQPGRNADE